MTGARTHRLRALVLLAALGLGSALGTAPLLAQGVLWNVRDGDLRVQCLLTIGGSFEAKTKMLNGSVRPGAAPTDPWSGKFTVALGSLDTGIGLRTQHMRDEYLEVGKGPEFANAVLTGVQLIGLDVAANGKGTFTARLRLHGVERPVSGQAELRRNGQNVRVRASFPVVLQDFGIAKPRYLGVGVQDKVTVQVAFEATPVENAR